MAKKELEELYEKYLKLFMPIWLPAEAIKMLIAEIHMERRKKQEREERL